MNKEEKKKKERNKDKEGELEGELELEDEKDKEKEDEMKNEEKSESLVKVKKRKGRMKKRIVEEEEEEDEIFEHIWMLDWKILTENLRFTVSITKKAGILNIFQKYGNDFVDHFKQTGYVVLFYNNPSFPRLNSTIKGLCSDNMKLLTKKDNNPKLTTKRKRDDVVIEDDMEVESEEMMAKESRSSITETDDNEDERKEDNEERKKNEMKKRKATKQDKKKKKLNTDETKKDTNEEEDDQVNQINHDVIIKAGTLINCFDDEFHNQLYRLLSKSFDDEIEIVRFIDLKSLFLIALPKEENKKGSLKTKEVFEEEVVTFLLPRNKKRNTGL